MTKQRFAVKCTALILTLCLCFFAAVLLVQPAKAYADSGTLSWQEECKELTKNTLVNIAGVKCNLQTCRNGSLSAKEK